MKIQISTRNAHHPVLGPRLDARVLTGPNAGDRESIYLDLMGRDGNDLSAVIALLVVKLGMSGPATYAGTLNNGGNVYDVEFSETVYNDDDTNANDFNDQ